LLEEITRGRRAGQGRDSALGGDARLVGMAAALVVPVTVRDACHRSGSNSPSCPAGIVGKRVSMSCKYGHGSTPSRWYVGVKQNGRPYLISASDHHVTRPGSPAPAAGETLTPGKS
jgi:hypothetical protein